MTCVEIFVPEKGQIVFKYDDMITIDREYLADIDDLLVNREHYLSAVSVQDELSLQHLVGESGYYYLWDKYAMPDQDHPEEAYFVVFGDQNQWNAFRARAEDWLREET